MDQYELRLELESRPVVPTATAPSAAASLQSVALPAAAGAVPGSLGVDGILLNTGIAHAKDPLRMADAMRHATEAGRLAYLAGRIPKRLYATASSPEEGVITAKPR